MYSASYSVEQVRGLRTRASNHFFALGATIIVLAFLFFLWNSQFNALIRVVFPLAVLGLGIIYYQLYPVLYISYTWWLWFLSPFIRRVVDYELGWVDPNPILLGSYLVTALTAFTMIRHAPRLLERTYFPFLIVGMCILYAYALGLINFGFITATYDLLQWIVPVTLGFHMAMTWEEYPRYREALVKVFTYGVLVMGVYGIIQFLYMPAWDAYWMEQSGLTVLGNPKPYEVRVFSTLNSAHPFSYVMMSGLIVAFSARGFAPMLVSAPGLPGFFLGLVRASWGGWVLGLIYMGVRLGGATRSKLLMVLVFGTCLAAPLLVVGPIADTVGARMETLTALEEDASLLAREGMYEGALGEILKMPLGTGLGATGTAQKTGSAGQTRSVDSGIIVVGVQLGWTAGLLYGFALVWLVLIIVRTRILNQDVFAIACVAVTLAMGSLVLFANTFADESGMVLWCFLGLSLGARNYFLNKQEEEASEANHHPAPIGLN